MVLIIQKIEKGKKQCNNSFKSWMLSQIKFIFFEAITRQLTTLRKCSSMKKFKKSKKNSINLFKTCMFSQVKFNDLQAISR